MGFNGRIVTSALLVLCPLWALCQDFPGGQEPDANIFKLDYNVPESPAFSILDANPTTVMRGNAAQEVVINLASDFINSNNINSGLALDFNPYFVFGGRLASVSEYRESGFKRLLANTQLSLATSASDEFADDLLFSGAMRITLFDSKDLLFDKTLSSDIDDALSIFDEDPMPGQVVDEVVDNSALKEAYRKAKIRYRESAGGSASIGYAIAGRAQNGSFKFDSIRSYRHQAWIAGQYDLGKSLMSLNGMLMYRYQSGINIDDEGVIGGLAVRYYGRKVIFTGEIIYDGVYDEIGFGAYIEAYLLPNIAVYASIGKDNSQMAESDGYSFKPGIKWNLSEPKSVKK